MNLDELYKLINEPLRGKRIPNDLVTIEFFGNGRLETDELKTVKVYAEFIKLPEEVRRNYPALHPPEEQAKITFQLDF